MYLIARYGVVNGIEIIDYFGPFTTEDRAREYSKSFEDTSCVDICPLIVPNCVQVKLMY